VHAEGDFNTFHVHRVDMYILHELESQSLLWIPSLYPSSNMISHPARFAAVLLILRSADSSVAEW
jgi:hypothetical protein